MSLVKIKAIKDFGIDGKAIKKGQEIEVADKDARYLVGVGKAKPAETKPVNKKDKA